jgi:hypothetical protein
LFCAEVVLQHTKNNPETLMRKVSSVKYFEVVR